MTARRESMAITLTKRAVAALGILAVAFTLHRIGPVNAVPTTVELEKRPVSGPLSNKPVPPFTARDLQALTLAVNFERASSLREPNVSEETIRELRYIAYVVWARAKDNKSYWCGSDIHDVVYCKNQFSFTLNPEGPIEGWQWNLAQQIAYEQLAGYFTPEPHMVNVRYYHVPEYSADKNVCWCKKQNVFVAAIGMHNWYRLAAEHEAAELKATDPPECVRYRAAVAQKEAKKRQLALHAKSRKAAKLARLAKKGKKIARLNKQKKIRTARR